MPTILRKALRTEETQDQGSHEKAKSGQAMLKIFMEPMIELSKEKPMIIDRYTKVLMTVFTLVLLLNGLNPWINPSQAVAIENTTTDGTKNGNNCSSQDKKISLKMLEGMNNLERLLGYIESSVNNIQLTVKGIDRKVSEYPSRNTTEKR